MYVVRLSALALCVIAFGVALVGAQGGAPVVTRDDEPLRSTVQWEPFIRGFDRPVYVTHAKDGLGRLFVVEQRGKIYIVENGAVVSQPFLDISHLLSQEENPLTNDETGLLGLAFHPNFAKNGRVFVSYTDSRNNSVVMVYRVSASDPNKADTESGQVIIHVPQPFISHNGGHIAFGPDGYLYFGLGDGGWTGDPLGAGQNLQILLGTILRIDVDSAQPYAIPPDNPFVGNDDALDEIWAYGLRNPWRFSFDRATGDLYIGDVGDWRFEEVNFQPSVSTGGENYGWNVWEGNQERAGGDAHGYVPPFFVYGHEHGCAVAGGYVYRGEALPDLAGVYFLGDFCSGRIWATWRNSGGKWRVKEFFDTYFTISSFGEDESGEHLLVDYRGGTIYRLVRAHGSSSPSFRETAPSASDFDLTLIGTGYDRPLYLTHAGDGSNRLFIVEQSGKIWVIKDGVQLSQPFLNVSEIISQSALGEDSTEQGLLGLAFHPKYRANGTFFITYTDRKGNTAVARYQVSQNNPDLADGESGTVIFHLAQPYANHNGGHVAFGPDGYLYISLGDGGSSNDPLGAGQNLALLLGSVMRINVDSDPSYAIPVDNPFVGVENARDEILSYGLRNAWRFSFDRLTGDMYLADVGQSSLEEVNFQPADSPGGENYGWNAWEGNQIFVGEQATNPVMPFFVYSHDHGCSVTGGYVYRGEEIPRLMSTYIFGDFCSGQLWAAWRDRDLNWHVIALQSTDYAISSFGEDEAGELYLIDYAGALYRFDAAEA